MKKVMVFGTFDGPHEGHKEMLKEAKSFGDYLVVVVAQNHIVAHLKGHMPKLDLVERMEKLRALDGINEVIIGDKELGTWEVVKKHQPAVIGIGHDQGVLKDDLESNLDKLGYTPEIVQLKAFEPNEYKSSKYA